jgi:hypothetical protein
MIERKRESERERETERYTDRQTDRQREREILANYWKIIGCKSSNVFIVFFEIP